MLGIAGCKQDRKVKPTKDGPESLKGGDALVVKAKTGGQELRVSPGAEPHALQWGLPVHGSQSENRKQ